MAAYLKLDHIDKTFRRGAVESEVLKDINLDIAKGEVISIIGHSGCGKSTLLNLIAGLTQVTSGGVLLEDREVNAPGPERAVVFQNHSLLPWLTCYENVQLAVDQTLSREMNKQQRHDWVLENLALVHMTAAKDKRPNEISGGMKQRIGIARALAMRPKVLLLDEPFGALDAMTRDTMNVELAAIAARSKKTVFLITHSIAEAVFLSDRVLVMSSRPGRIVEVIPVELPRPRGLDIIADPGFAATVLRIRRLLDGVTASALPSIAH